MLWIHSIWSQYFCTVEIASRKASHRRLLKYHQCLKVTCSIRSFILVVYCTWDSLQKILSFWMYLWWRPTTITLKIDRQLVQQLWWRLIKLRSDDREMTQRLHGPVCHFGKWRLSLLSWLILLILVSYLYCESWNHRFLHHFPTD